MPATDGNAPGPVILKLMPDYQCFPLWRVGEDFDNLDPADLPLSGELQARLLAWADVWDATLNWDDPASSSFPDDAARDKFIADGERLAVDLRAELGGGFVVEYWRHVIA